VASKIFHGTLEGYWEQGWEGRISFVFQPDDSTQPIFLQHGQRLTILNDDGTTLWSGIIQFVKRGWRDNHNLDADIWSYIKQKDVTYAQWMEWFWRKPPLKATLEIEDEVTELSQDHPNINKNIHPPVLMLIHLAIAYVAKWAIPIPLALPNFVRTIGFALVTLGFLLGVGAFVEFRKAHTTLDPHGSVAKLVSSGVYRFSRNPIYLGFVLMLAGFPLFSGTVWGALLVPVLILNMNNLVIQHEEAYLEKKFGEEYTRYKSRVRRWV
jgi:protein-S-isoprenylcysteine O-methyltransferase Ste14